MGRVSRWENSGAMKRYWRFDFDLYYPGGGMNDFTKDFDTLTEAVDFKPKYEMDCTMVIDSTNIKEVYKEKNR